MPAKTRRTGQSQREEMRCGESFTWGSVWPNHSASRIARMASLRVSGSSRSMNMIPSRWSVSCCTAAGQQLGALDDDRLAELVHALGHDAHRPPGVEREVGHRQAALVALLHLLGEVEHGVDEVADHVVDVVDEDPQADAELRGRETGARGVDHRVGEVLDELAQLLVEGLHRGCRGREHRVAEQADGLDGHAGHSFVDERVGTVYGRWGRGRRPLDQPRTTGSTRTVTGAPSLRALRTAAPACRAAASAAPDGRSATTRARTRVSAPVLRRGAGTGTGPSTVAPRGSGARARAGRRRRPG